MIGAVSSSFYPLVVEVGREDAGPNPAHVCTCGVAVVIPHIDSLARFCRYIRDMFPWTFPPEVVGVTVMIRMSVTAKTLPE